MQEQQLKNFTLVNNFAPGFKAKRDVTREARGAAVSGSQNIVTIDGEKIGVRSGFSLFGSSSPSSTLAGILGGGSWKTSTATEIPWRSYYDPTNFGTIEIYDGSAWRLLSNGYASAAFRTLGLGGQSIGWWSATEVKDLLLMVNGDSNIYMWSGGVATFSSCTVNTITLEGTDTWAEKRFLVSNTYGTRTIRVLDDGGTWREATYTGGEGTTTITGTTDLTSYTISPGQPILQKIITNSNKPSSTYSNDFIGMYKNYVFYFDKERHSIEMSKNTDYSDFTAASSPRLPGEASSFNIDEPPTASVVQPDGNSFFISSRNLFFQFIFTPSADNTKELITIVPLKSSPLEGATNELAIVNLKNEVVYVSGEPAIDTLGRIENIDTPQSTTISDEIKNYMDAAVTTSAMSAFYKNNLYTTLQESTNDVANNRFLVRNLATTGWETPWTIPTNIIFEYAGELYFHDAVSPNTWKMFDGYSDGSYGVTDGAPITAKWYSSFDNYGAPFNQKEFDTIWIDGYIRPNTTLEIYITYDFGSETKTYTLVGTDDGVVIQETGGGLGYYNLGERNLGGRAESLSASGLRRFRGFIPIAVRPFYELQTSFQSSGVDYRWEITSFGYNVRIIEGTNNNLSISQV